jgi:hypothetical protein
MAGIPKSSTDARTPGLPRAVSAATALGRLAIGVGLAFAPGLALRTLGFTKPSPQLVAVSRLAGGRDIVLGAVTLAALDDPPRLRGAVFANAAVDAGDALTFAVALRDGDTRQAALRGLAAAVPAALTGLWLARVTGAGSGG